MSTQLAGELVRLLGIKKELLQKILTSLRRSANLLQEDDMDAFDAEMESCDDIRAKVDELGHTLDSIQARIDPAQHEESAALLDAIAHILKDIDQAWKECNDVAAQKLFAYGQQIKSIRHTKKGIDGYANQFIRRDAVFVDEKK